MSAVFQSYYKKGYQAELTNAVLSRDGRTLYLEVEVNFYPSQTMREEEAKRLCASIQGVETVHFNVRFSSLVQPLEELLEGFFADAQSRWPEDPFAAGLGQCRRILEGDTLRVFVVGTAAAQHLQDTLAGEISHLLEQITEIPLQVVFEDDANLREKALAHVERCLAESSPWESRDTSWTPPTRERSEKPCERKPEGIGTSQAGTPVSMKTVDKEEAGGEHQKKTKTSSAQGKSTLLYGKAISGAPVAMDQLPHAGQPVVLQGEIFELETKEIVPRKKRKGSPDYWVLVTFYFTDQKSAQCAQLFAKPEEWEAMKGSLKKGKEVLVAGDVDVDRYIRSEYVEYVKVNALALVEKKSRQDTALEKRIEFHAHTKMSQLDGLSEPSALVQRAIDWGHKAIAITDHGVVHALPESYDKGYGKIKVVLGMEGYLYDDAGLVAEDGTIDIKAHGTYHIVLLAKNDPGRINLYKLVSMSHMQYFYKKPRIPRSVLEAHREGLLLGSACEAGELFQAMVKGASQEELERIASWYDYLEVQPVANNAFMIKNDRYPATSVEDLRDYNRRIVALGKKLGKPVIATSDTHYIDPSDKIARDVVQAGMGFSEIEEGEGLYLRTTDEMLQEFAYLGEEDCQNVVIHNPAFLNEQIQDVRPTPGEGHKGRKYPPTIKGSDETLRKTCEKRVREKYGDPVPEEISQRLEKELSSIIDNGYSVMYVSAKMLVDKTNQDGYVVGSRGSVGSSFAACMAGITEVNPLVPHYVCPQCKHLEWGDREKYDCGIDMPLKDCPQCGTTMDREGFTIPFETFLGFAGDKEPDIDLNFAGEYQPRAHKYVDEIFGAKNVFKAGTIGTIAEKSAAGFVMAWSEKTGHRVNRFAKSWLAHRMEGIKRTTGQHPGGIIIVPDDHDIHEFTPVQYPANDATKGVKTTHFDFHKIDDNLLKLDILGHDAPTMVRQLYDITGINPETVPYSDEKVLGIFNGIDTLGIQDPHYRFVDGTYGISEFGTRTTRGILHEMKPQAFTDLVRISGLSHGTDVWDGNAQELIKKGIATEREVIATRDDIMTYLIAKGLPNKEAFDIMEHVRKGKGIPKEEWEKDMRDHDVPDWYIDSCKKIAYMFPRAHAAAYTIMSCRCAWFKVFRPDAFYAAYFTTKLDDFNWEVIREGSEAVCQRMDTIDALLREADRSTNTTKIENEKVVLEVAYEMLSRGLDFQEPSFDHSRATQFMPHEGKVIAPLAALSGVGGKAAASLVEAYQERPFLTIEDLQTRSKANRTAVEALRMAGLLEGMAESDQLSFF